MGPAPARDRTWLELTVRVLRFLGSHAFAAGLCFVLMVAGPLFVLMLLGVAAFILSMAMGSGMGPLFVPFLMLIAGAVGSTCLALGAALGLSADLLRRLLAVPILLGPALAQLLALVFAALAGLLFDNWLIAALALAALGSVGAAAYSGVQSGAELVFEGCERLVRAVARHLTSPRPSGAGTPR